MGEATFLFVWNSEGQSLSPAENGQSPAIEFTNSIASGDNLVLATATEIEVTESGYYNISWQVFKTGYDSAFALFYDESGGLAMVPGSNYGAMAHDEQYQGQAIAYLAEGGTLTLNRIDNLYNQSILNQIGDGTYVTGASIVIVKIA